jgi:hypothetical protein
LWQFCPTSDPHANRDHYQYGRCAVVYRQSSSDCGGVAHASSADFYTDSDPCSHTHFYTHPIAWHCACHWATGASGGA